MLTLGVVSALAMLLGAMVGIAVALASTRLLDALRFEIDAVNGIVFAAMALTMIAIGMLASYLPARRASNVIRQCRCAPTRELSDATRPFDVKMARRHEVKGTIMS